MLLAQAVSAASLHQPDTAPLSDPERAVYALSRTSFDLRYATASACKTMVRVSLAGHPDNVVTIGTDGGDASLSFEHHLHVSHLLPGRRYIYQVWDPNVTPSAREAALGAASGWSRAYACSTLAPSGSKTLIRLPIKVLLMPNVINVASAVQPDGSLAPEPTKATPEQIALIENEYKLASRTFFVNSGMRLWVDFHFFVDDRWQRWGEPATAASTFFKNLPLCRNYAGADFLPPAGGTPTWFDTHDLTKSPTVAPQDGFAGQIEMPWLRRWDPAIKEWILVSSQQATVGATNLVKGSPSQSVLMAGGDTAWLVASALQDQLAAMGSLSLEDTENDRIVGDAPVVRHRFRRGDGTYDEADWNSAGQHGEAWDYLKYWDSRVSDIQWLRLAYGSTVTVLDKNGDGFPDKDASLPLDAARFAKFMGSSSYAAACDYDWVGLPIQPSWLKDRSKVSTRLDGDAIVNVPVSGKADEAEWASIPTSGTLHSQDLNVDFKQAYDATAYHGYFRISGPFSHLDLDFDGDEKGLYGSPSSFGLTVTNLKPQAGEAGPMVLPVSVKPTIGGAGNRLATWLSWTASRKPDGAVILVLTVPNGGDSPWYWRGAGHQVGVAINAYDQTGRGWSMGAPYHLDYAAMLARRGLMPRPSAPAALDTATVALKPGDKAFSLSTGWSLQDGTYVHQGVASAIVLPNQKAVAFDLSATVQGPGEIGLGAYASQTPRPELDRDYGAMLTDSGTEISVYGDAADPEPIRLGAGAHKLELRRRENGIWLLVDGSVQAYAPDSNPKVVLNRFALLAGTGSTAKVTEVAYREASDSGPGR